MITLQLRGTKFQTKRAGEWYRVDVTFSGVMEEMKQSLGLKDDYLITLTREGEAFRQRIVDYTPPQEAGA